MTVHPAKTRINLGICPVWSESSLCTQWVDKEQSFLRADSGCPDWSESSLGVQTTLLVLSWGRCRRRFSKQLVVLTKKSMLKRLHSLEANATCGIADADYTEWRKFNPHRRTIRSPIKKLFAVSLPTHFNPLPLPRTPYPEPVWHFWKIKHFLALFSSENHNFSHYGAKKEKYNINLFFPTYPTKKYRVGVQQTNTF